MSELDKLLKRARPREPSPGYLERGLARIAAAAAPSDRIVRRWRYAAIGFALLFAGSLSLNVLHWAGNRQQTVSETTFVHSVLRREGDILIRETLYQPPRSLAETGEETSNE